ncbi:MAG: flagellar basal body-associated FliL family protein [SAR324 cluster bacterium]|nr:flagellar basal body-associated FliL family protein [SAR324 cluster bacterium]
MAEEEVGEGGGGGKGKLIIIIVAVLILLLVGAGAAWFFIFSGSEEEEVPKEEEVTQAVPGAGQPLENPQFMSLGTYIANLQDGRRYLKTSISLMLSEEAAVTYLNTRLVQVKDIVLTELQSLSIEKTKDPESKESLKNKLMTEIAKLFPKTPDWDDPEPIKEVLFEEFYVQ